MEKWAYSDDGVLDRRFFLDDKVHRFGSWAEEYRASQPDSHTILLTEGEHGYEYHWWTFLLSSDGTQLTVKSRQQAFNGAQHEGANTYRRIGKGGGFEGSWKPLPPPSPPPPSPEKEKQPSEVSAPRRAQPNYVIWTDSEGIISWYYPSTGELERGKLDGHVRPIFGPLNDGESFSFRPKDSRSFEFTAYDEGKPAFRSVEEISSDGQTLTETYWKPEREENKIVVIFRRLP